MRNWSLDDKKALIVDDAPTARFTLKAVLQSFYCENIKLAKDADEALYLIQNNRFDFILCDYNLGEGKNGQQLFEEVKFLEILPCSTVFIIIADENISQIVAGMLDWMADDYVQKPITKMILFTHLKRLLARKADLMDISYALQDNKDYANALKMCDIKLAEGPSAPFELMKLKADLLVKRGDYKQAVDYCRKIFDIREINEIGFLLGQAYFCLGQFEEAEAVLIKILENCEDYTLAYDLLAKISVQRGELLEAQRLLEKAVKQSPKSILRQRELGEISYKNGYFATAEKAFRQAVKLSPYSCYKTFNDYIRLADTLIKNNQHTDAIDLIKFIKKEFQNNKTALLTASVLEAGFFKAMKNNKLSLSAANSALALFEQNSEKLSSELILDLAETCFALGKTEQSLHLVEHAVRKQPDDLSLLAKIRNAFVDKPVYNQVEKLIEQTTLEFRKVNQLGMRLAQQGRIEESITLFIEAAKSLPQNVTINLNAAHYLIMQMSRGSVTQENLQLSKQFLTRVQAINPSDERLQNLLVRFNRLASSVK